MKSACFPVLLIYNIMRNICKREKFLLKYQIFYRNSSNSQKNESERNIIFKCFEFIERHRTNAPNEIKING